MSTAADAIALVLAADTTLTALLTGGVYTWDASGRNGISPESLPSAYSNGFLKPVGLVWKRSEVPWGGGHDAAVQWKTLRDVVEIYLYNDGDSTYTTIESAAARVEKDLDDKFITGAGFLKAIYRYYDRDTDLNNSIYIRIDFQVVHSRQLS